MLEKLKEIIADQLNVDADSITAESRFKEDLEADSLDLFELVIIFGASVRCIIFLLAVGSLLVIRLVFLHLVFFAHLVVFFLFLLLLIFKISRKLSIRKESKRR